MVKPTNHPPILSGLATFSSTIILKDIKNDAYNFGPITDEDSGDFAELTYTVQPSNGNAFFKLDPLTGIFYITDRNGLVKSLVTIYEISIFLKDSNLETLGNSTYFITFLIDINRNQSNN